MNSLFDEDLRKIMGDRYDDGETPSEMPVMEQKATPKEERVRDVVPAAEYVPAPKTQRGTMERLKHGTAWIGVCGGIAMLMWWFWVNDLMAMEAAYPCILACGVIGAFGAGMNFRK